MTAREAMDVEQFASAGGRVVKFVGDEIMFVADTAEAGCEVALRLVEDSPTMKSFRLSEAGSAPDRRCAKRVTSAPW